MTRPRAAAIVVVLAAAVAAGVAFVLLSGGPEARKRTAEPVAIRKAPADGIPEGSGALVASVARGTWMRASPAGKVLGRIGPRTQFGSPDALLVVKVSPGWLGVLSELAGNGRVGWVPRANVSLARDSYLLRASLSAKNLVVVVGGRVLARYAIGIGASWAPTPTGQFAVTDRIVTGQPYGPYGCCIVALTATAPHAIPGWTGGNRIAIHATADTASIGQPDSHGCVRVTAANASWLVRHVPNGTPVTITG
jgi:lipoprotein-anchoring transpeptidase ErfK/SrfK